MFPPLAGVDFVQLDDGNSEFRLRVENTANRVNVTTEFVPVTESLLNMILRLIEAHRRAHAP